jgi:hypothetical protein
MIMHTPKPLIGRQVAFAWKAKQFFFEKKNQKTSAHLGSLQPERPFFQKGRPCFS